MANGFLIGAAIPVLLGLFVIVRDWVYISLQPDLPNVAYCGTGIAAGFMLIIIGGPICGTIGAVIGFVVVAIRDVFWRSRNESPPQQEP